MAQILYTSLFAVYVLLFVWLIFKWNFFDVEGLKPKWLTGFFLLKVVAGIGLTLIYTYYYPDKSKQDIYRYFHDSCIISSLLFSNPVVWLKIMTGIGMYDADTFKYITDTQHFSHPVGDMVTSNEFLIRLITLLNYFSIFNIYINTLFFSFISFIGFTLLYKTLKPFFSGKTYVLVFATYLVPSVVFWTSGLLKETIIITGLSLYLFAWFRVYGKHPLKYGAMLFAGLLLIVLVKVYIAVWLIICSMFLPLGRSYTGLKYPLLRRVGLLVVIMVVVWFYYGSNFCEKIIYKRDEFILLGIAENAGSTLDAALVDPNCKSFFALLPGGMVSAIFRPFLWDAGPRLQVPFAVENLVVFGGLLLLLLSCCKVPRGRSLWLALFCFTFSLLNYMVIGVSIPLMGAVVHYRVIAIPFLIVGLALFIDEERLRNLVKGKG